MIQLIDLDEWHHYQSHQFLKIILQTFGWIIIIIHCCLLVWLTYVRFLKTVNNGFLLYSIQGEQGNCQSEGLKLSALSLKGWVEFSYPLFKWNSCHTTFFYALYWQGSCFTFLKHRGSLDLPIRNISNFFPVTWATAMSVNFTLLFLPPEHFSPDRW